MYKHKCHPSFVPQLGSQTGSIPIVHKAGALRLRQDKPNKI
jgi:hypothetical protein